MRKEINYLVIDGVPSTDFGVYVTNAGAYKVPQKDYELKDVSGRNGAVYLDKGRWDNVDLKYPAFVIGDFTDNYDAFIAFLMSKTGYFRLEDTIRPGIYREGLFVGSVEPKMSRDGKMGVFNITFSCKPQKFLKSGEEPIEIPLPQDGLIWDSVSTHINNPTRFPSSPLVQIYGSGDLIINDYKISVQNTPYGMINVVDFTRATSPANLFCYFKPWLYNVGDYAFIHARWWVKFKLNSGTAIRAETVSASGECTQDVVVDSTGIVTAGTYLDENISFWQIGTTTSTLELTSTVRVYYLSSGSEAYQDVTVTQYIDETDEYIKLRSLVLSNNVTYVKETKQVDSIIVNSTVPSLGNPLNVDMETGDAYKVEDGQKVYVNNAVWVGEKLPVLAPGDNYIEQHYTMTKVVIIPRWWTI